MKLLLIPSFSRRGSLAAALLVSFGLLCAGATPAHAQIAHEKPGKVKAANRRALREARRTDAPYKDTHLQVTRDQLKRGKSEQPAPEGSKDLRFRDGTPTVKEPGFLGLGRKKQKP